MAPLPSLEAIAARVLEPLLQEHFYRIPSGFVYCVPYLFFHRQFVRSVSERHERALKRMAVDFAPDLDQAAGSKKLNRFRPDNECPSTLGGNSSAVSR
jgi:hypothetical protein